MVSATVQAFLLDTNLSKSGEFICVYNFTRAVSTSYKRRKKPPKTLVITTVNQDKKAKYATSSKLSEMTI